MVMLVVVVSSQVLLWCDDTEAEVDERVMMISTRRMKKPMCTPVACVTLLTRIDRPTDRWPDSADCSVLESFPVPRPERRSEYPPVQLQLKLVVFRSLKCALHRKDNSAVSVG